MPPGVAVGAAAPSWRRLGFLSLDANEQSGHQVEAESIPEPDALLPLSHCRALSVAMKSVQAGDTLGCSSDVSCTG